ncbi:alpha/beta hydrolase [Arthrobacter sp. efr-133-R2A-63]|uniref:alpha/beta hydrolase n=1 Tax=Arthrobacter sp. efr-133-R2A-63 TaxID=3040278 RepID=UPI00254ED8C3|nr:alpha/beta hydrolase [Arthrobacter sp. efr-133-R2A-63]
MPPRAHSPATAGAERILETVTDMAFPGPHGPVPARLYGSPDPATPTLVWLHGGAFSHGDLDMPEAHDVGLGLAARGIHVISVDYRRVPPWSPFRKPRSGKLTGIRFPIPLDDVTAAFTAVAKSLSDGGVETTGIALGGASAGACLAAAATLDLGTRQNGPSSLVLAYPTLHAQLPPLQQEVKKKLRGPRGLWQFTPATVERMNRNYAGSLQHMNDPRAFPGGADLSQFPDTLILSAEYDTLRTSGDAFASELAAYDIPVENEYLPGTRHGFLNRPATPAMTTGLERIASWLQTRPRSRI